MYVRLKKEDVEDLQKCIEENRDIAYEIVRRFVHDEEIAAELESKFQEILNQLDRVYNPELIKYKRQVRAYYKVWLNLKDTDKKMAYAAYLKYLKLKREVAVMEVPF
jgi:transcription initiation factor IIE alpha subunit